MPPSATESLQQLAEQVQQKVVPVSAEAKPANGNDTHTPGSELPKLETNHREPLKLSGVLDQFTSFEVTPVIGKEFPNADLAKWLRAPNGDELLRDLAITSE